MQRYFSLDPKTLNVEKYAEALASLMFILENQDGRIKARSCADGSKQIRRPGYKK